MVKKEVKVFDLSKVTDKDKDFYEEKYTIDFPLKSFDKKVINKKGDIKISIKDETFSFTPLENNISVAYKYEYDDLDKNALQMFKSSEKKAEDVLDSCRRKRKRFEEMLLENTLNELDVDKKEVIYSLRDCDLSVIGKCVFHNEECLFCYRKGD